jgi:hypothetical protein
MRKLLAGCLTMVLVGVVALGVALYFGVNAVRPMIDSATSWMQQGQAVVNLSDRVENKTPFQAPASGELTESQVQRFLRVHDRVRRTMGSRWTELESRTRAFQDSTQAKAAQWSLAEVGGLLSELGHLVVEARQAQVDALNAEGFSSSEYSWVRLRLYEAAGLEAAQAVDWSAAERMIKDGADKVGVAVPSVPAPSVPERNRELAKPHIAELRTWLPLTALGF